MDQRTDDIQRSIKETRHDIEETRASMTEKLELLEERVRETVESARSTVDDIMDNVKDTVDETVGAVKETVVDAKASVEEFVENVKDTMDDTVTTMKRTFDFQYQVEQRPWLMFGGSIMLGYLLGCLSNRGVASYERTYSERTYGDAATRHAAGAEALQRSGYYAAATSARPSGSYQAAGAQPQSTGLWSGALGQFREEFDIVKSAVIGAVMSNVRDMVRQSMPRMAPQLEKAIDSASAKLGAEPPDGHEQQRHDQAQRQYAGMDQHGGARASESSQSQTPRGGQHEQVAR
jgi:ElaB/YqjD/DUF883 family membrane-anchored ribosome-binding protein